MLRVLSVRGMCAECANIWVATGQVVPPMLCRGLISLMTGWSTHVRHSIGSLQHRLEKLLQYRSWQMQMQKQLPQRTWLDTATTTSTTTTITTTTGICCRLRMSGVLIFWYGCQASTCLSAGSPAVEASLAQCPANPKPA